jgi:hypothetical protein
MPYDCANGGMACDGRAVMKKNVAQNASAIAPIAR